MKRLLAAALAVAASPVTPPDYYEARLRAGEAALTAGRAAEAAEDLRIAAFGLLGQPPLLCRALANLAVAQDRAARPAEAKATLRRIAEIENGFPACREADLDSARRAELGVLARKLLAREAAERLLAPPTIPPPAPSPTAVRVVPSAEPTRAATPTAVPQPAMLPPSPPSPARASATPAAVSEDLDRQPQLKVTTRPVYPAGAQRAGIGGIVLLRVLVSERGEPLRVEIARGVRPDLDEAALAAVRGWRFEPGMRGGRAVASWMTVAVPFEGVRR